MTWYLPSNVTSIAGMFTYVNDITGSLFAWLTLLSLFLITFIAQKDRYTTDRALVTSCFIVMLGGMFFWLLNFIAFKWIMFLVIALAASVLFIYIREKKAS